MAQRQAVTQRPALTRMDIGVASFSGFTRPVRGKALQKATTSFALDSKALRATVAFKDVLAL
jgi:hypothetical protein